MPLADGLNHGPDGLDHFPYCREFEKGGGKGYHPKAGNRDLSIVGGPAYSKERVTRRQDFIKRHQDILGKKEFD